MRELNLSEQEYHVTEGGWREVVIKLWGSNLEDCKELLRKHRPGGRVEPMVAEQMFRLLEDVIREQETEADEEIQNSPDLQKRRWCHNLQRERYVVCSVEPNPHCFMTYHEIQ